MSNSIPKLVIIPLFDLVIADHKPLISIFQQSMQTQHIEAEDWVLRELIGKPISEVISTLCQRGDTAFTSESTISISHNISEQLKVMSSKPSNAHSKEVDQLLKTLYGKGIKIGITSWLNKESTKFILDANGLSNRIDGISHANSGYLQGTSPDSLFALMRQIGISNTEQVANLGKTKYDILRGYHAQCKWNVLIAEDKDNPRWNAYPQTSVTVNLKDAINEILKTSGSSDFFAILNNKKRNRGK